MNFISACSSWWEDNSPAKVRAIAQDIQTKVNDLQNWKIESKKELEEEITNIHDRYMKQKNLTEAVIDHLDDILWCKDLKGKYILANKSFRDNFCYGISWEELNGKTDEELSKKFKTEYGELNHTFGEVCNNTDNIVLQNKKPMKFLETGKINGKTMRLVVNKSPIYNFKGIIFGTCGTGRDVTQWYNDLTRAIEECELCNNSVGRELLLKELRSLENK